MSSANNRRSSSTDGRRLASSHMRLLRRRVIIPAVDKKSTGKTQPPQSRHRLMHRVIMSLIALMTICALLTLEQINGKDNYSFNPFRSLSKHVDISGGDSRSIAQQKVTGITVSRQHTTTSGKGTSSPMAGYHVVGKQILDGQGAAYVPYGVQLVGLDNPNWRTYPGTDHLNQAEVNAARQVWYSNVISIQLNTAALFANFPYDPDYLTKVDQVVNWATQQNMNVLLVLQYQESTQQALPTQDSIRFWDFISKHYITNPRVFFDLFNEPHNPTSTTDDAALWSVWRNGETIDNVAYVGMQQLVNTIRGNGNQNLIFADGLGWATDILLLHNYLLTGNNIVYAVHPDIEPTDPSNPQATWDFYYGSVIRVANFPVVADEWSNSQDPRGCWKDANTIIPQLLAYLRQQHMGLIVWGLFPGLLIRGWDYTKPTAYDQSNYLCNDPWPSYTPNAQGPGQLVLALFKMQNP